MKRLFLLCLIFLSGCVNVTIKDAEYAACVVTNNYGQVLMYRENKESKLQLPVAEIKDNRHVSESLKKETLKQTGYMIVNPIRVLSKNDTLIHLCPKFDKLHDEVEVTDLDFYFLRYISDKDLKYSYIIDLKERSQD